MSSFGTLWRRSPAFKGLFLLAAGASVLYAALSLHPQQLPQSAQSRSLVTQSRFDASAPKAAATSVQPAETAGSKDPSPVGAQTGGRATDKEPPVAAAPSSSSKRASQVVTPVLPDTSIAPASGGSASTNLLMGKNFAGQVIVQKTAVPLPEGEWVVVAHFPASAPGAVESVFLARLRDGKLAGATIIQVNSAAGQRASGFRKSQQCSRTAVLHAKIASNEDFGSQDCWTINHNLSVAWTQNSAPGVIRAAAGELGVRGIKLPPVMLSTFYRMANRQNFLHAIYYFNPEIDGIVSTPTPIWEESDWHRQYLNQYPEKVAYVQKLREWAETWHSRVLGAFESAQTGLPLSAAQE